MQIVAVIQILWWAAFPHAVSGTTPTMVEPDRKEPL
jgi:hypothetical protein